MKSSLRIGLFILSVLTIKAQATLGGPPTSVEGDRKALGLTSAAVESVAAQKASCYSVQEINSDGVHIKEFVNTATNQVFMISFMGYKYPDLSQLMGAEYFKDFEQTQNTPQRHSKVQSRLIKKVTASTARLQVGVQVRGRVHKSRMILKTAVPACVADAEALL